MLPVATAEYAGAKSLRAAWPAAVVLAHLLVATGWMVGVSVAMAGAIGFIGLVIPHTCAYVV